MIASFQQYLTRFADAFSWLALLTACVFVALYGVYPHGVLLVLCALYAILGAAGIYRHHRRLPDEVIELDSDTPPTRTLETSIPPERVTFINTRMSVTVDGLVRASRALNEVSEQQSGSAQEQADVITRANQRLDDFLQMSEGIRQQVRSVTQTAREAADISEEGRGAIQQSLHSMEDIRQQVEAIGDTITTLARLTRRIDTIISSVSEIATQSNLLALNASIEAARAGSQGRGFAVVADEVRVLAQQSTESASQVREILGEIQRAMKDTVAATRAGLDHVETGMERTEHARTIMQTLGENVSDSRTAVSDVYDVIRQQAEGMEDIVIQMDRLQRLTEDSLDSVRTAEAVSSNLSHLAQDLKVAVQDEPAFQT
jgi:methyl-accepting chemotaxis protein